MRIIQKFFGRGYKKMPLNNKNHIGYKTLEEIQREGRYNRDGQSTEVVVHVIKNR